MTESDLPTFAEEVLRGLRADHKSLPCRFFYDARGSELFEQICELEEYYPTRAEIEILERYAPEIMRQENSNAVIELGSGSARKARVLLSSTIAQHGSAHYVPIDISRTAVENCGSELVGEFEKLEVTGVIGTYESGVRIATAETAVGRTVLWLGGSIGNFKRAQAAELLRACTNQLDWADRWIVGIDLRKDAHILERAYDDDAGVTAEFNFNLLRRMNREFGARFDLETFRYVAEYDADDGGVHMFLESKIEQDVEVPDLDLAVHLDAGERIHTEDSFKYSLGEIEQLAVAAGLRLTKQWFDKKRQFSVNELTL